MQRKKILVIGTGGTAAGKGKKGKSTGYTSGDMSINEVISESISAAVDADIECTEVCRINSDDITAEIWYTLAKTIEDAAKRNDIAGIVVLHGTDTLEETAYLLHLTLNTEKPVVLTGAMRPPTALSADGDGNIAAAINVASDKNSWGKGVLTVFADAVFSARYAVKTNTYSLNAINGGEYGTLGIIRDNKIFWQLTVSKPHTVNTEFTSDNIKIMPKVSIIYFCADTDTSLLEYAIKTYDGIVVAGAGAGEYSENFKKIIKKSPVPIIISTRTNSGVIASSSLLSNNTVSAYDLPPSKAVILLRLALTVTSDINKINDIFLKY